MEFSLRCSFKHLFLYVPLSAVSVIICELVTIGIYDAQIRFCFCKLSCWGQAGGKPGASWGQAVRKPYKRGALLCTHYRLHACSLGRGSSPKVEKKGVKKRGLATSPKIDKQRIKKRGSWSDSMSALMYCEQPSQPIPMP